MLSNRCQGKSGSRQRMVFIMKGFNMPRRSGRGETPKRVTMLLENAVKKSSQSAVARDLNIGVAAVNRYLNGIGEPTQETLEKLSVAFGVTVAWLRNEEDRINTLELALKNLIDITEKHHRSPHDLIIMDKYNAIKSEAKQLVGLED